IGILGDRDYGKTSIVFDLLKKYQGKRGIVLFAYPDTSFKYRQIHTLSELELTTSSIVFMDELQKHIKFYQRSMNDEFLELLSTMAHNNNTLLFTTPMSQFITKSLDCFIDGFIYTKISDLGQLKNGSKAKRLLQAFSCVRISKRTLRLEKGEYLQIIDGQEQTNGVHRFSNPFIKKAWNANNSLKIPQKESKNIPKTRS
ncbi:hypothetical protein LCGC14_1978290, partial [marine sediment metagenome]